MKKLFIISMVLFGLISTATIVQAGGEWDFDLLGGAIVGAESEEERGVKTGFALVYNWREDIGVGVEISQRTEDISVQNFFAVGRYNLAGYDTSGLFLQLGIGATKADILGTVEDTWNFEIETSLNYFAKINNTYGFVFRVSNLADLENGGSEQLLGLGARFLLGR